MNHHSLPDSTFVWPPWQVESPLHISSSWLGQLQELCHCRNRWEETSRGCGCWPGDWPKPHPSLSPNPTCIHSSCADKRGHYPSKCVVERILVLGLRKEPSLVTTHSPGEETVLPYFPSCFCGNRKASTSKSFAPAEFVLPEQSQIYQLWREGSHLAFLHELDFLLTVNLFLREIVWGLK